MYYKRQFRVISFISGIIFLLFFIISAKANDKDNNVVKDLVKTLTLKEKISLLHGMGTTGNEFGGKDVPYFGIKGIPKKGIPDFIMGHGITGVRTGRDTKVHSTYFGSPIAFASTWNVNLYGEVGSAIAKEMRGLGQDLNLGPTLNIIRNPLGGRNWECLSEDPFLISKFIVPYVKEMQSNGIVCGPKHFVANNQERNRFDINNVVDERTLREIYLPGFKAAVIKGNAMNIMGAYNRLNGKFMCQNDILLNNILRSEWGFKGFVLSDFAKAVHSTIDAVNGGLDVEMSGPNFYGEKLLTAVRQNKVSEDKIDSMVTNVLTVMYKIGAFNRPRIEHKELIHCKEHIDLSKKVAVESVVLLKNEDNILPLKKKKIKSIAVIGPNAVRPESMKLSPYYLQGGGSGRTYYFTDAVVDPLEGIKNVLDKDTKVFYSQGCQTPDISNSPDKMKPESYDNELIAQAVKIAKSCEYTVVFVGLTGSNESEGRDRKNCLLPGKQNELIKKVAAANSNTIVVLISGSYVNVSSWIKDVKGFMFAPYSGEQMGNGIAEILMGNESPSGHLSISWPFSENDYPENSIFKGNKYSKSGESNVYAEGVFVGYRWFDKQKIDVLYPFGFGLSYSTFVYSNLNVDNISWPVKVSVDIKNTGNMVASDVMQIYVNDKISHIDKPVNELKEFQKIKLNPGEKQTLFFNLDKSAFSNYNVKSKAWEIEKGEFIISVGDNSRNFSLKKSININ